MSLEPNKSKTKDLLNASSDSSKPDKTVLHKSTSKWNFTKINTRSCSGHQDEVNCVAFSEDFEMMITGSDDGLVRVFNAVSNRLVASLSGHSGAVRALAISSGSRLIASGSHDKSIRIWRTRDATCLFILQEHSKSVECLSFSKDSSLLCSGSWDKTAILWNVTDGTKCRIFSEHQDLVQSVAFSFNDKYLATGSWDCNVIVWKISKPISPGSSPGKAVETDKEMVNRDFLHVLTGHTGNVHAVAFSPEGMLASGSWDRTVRLWNPRNGVCFFTLTGHTAWVQSVSFSYDSLYLVSASEDDSIRVWNCATGECVKQLNQSSTDMVSHCAFGSGTHEVIMVSGPASFNLACYRKTKAPGNKTAVK